MGELDVPVDGRIVGVRDVGDPEWPCVIHFHALPSSRLEPAFGDAEAAAAAVRVVCFDRPGFGRSEPVRYSLSSIGVLAGRVADALEIERFACLGFSGGAPYPLAAAAALPDRVSAVGVLAGHGPYDQVPGGLDELDDLDHQARALLPDHLDEAEAVAAEMFAPLVGFGADGEAILAFFEGSDGDEEPDEIAQDPSFRPYLASTVGEGMRQGGIGGIYDNLAWLGDWDFDLGDVRCPTWLWYSRGDSLTSLEHGRYLASRIPHARLTLWDERSHFGHIRHWSEVLSSLVAT